MLRVTLQLSCDVKCSTVIESHPLVAGDDIMSIDKADIYNLSVKLL